MKKHYDSRLASMDANVADALRRADAEKARADQAEAERQLAQLIGKTRLYQFLPPSERKLLPAMEFTDSHINAIARAYYADKNFGRENSATDIDLWRVYNLFTGANKSSYIDTFLDRSLNATNLIIGIGRALEGDSEYRWFIE